MNRSLGCKIGFQATVRAGKDAEHDVGADSSSRNVTSAPRVAKIAGNGYVREDPMRRRRKRRTIKTLVLISLAVGALVALSPSTWREAVYAMHSARGTRARRSQGPHESSMATPSRSAERGFACTALMRPRAGRVVVRGGRNWPCGREATRALTGRIGGRTVSCEERDRDRYGRVVAVCRAGGEDVNAWMVAEGWAFAYRKYSPELCRRGDGGEGGKARHLAGRSGCTLGMAQG